MRWLFRLNRLFGDWLCVVRFFSWVRLLNGLVVMALVQQSFVGAESFVVGKALFDGLNSLGLELGAPVHLAQLALNPRQVSLTRNGLEPTLAVRQVSH